MTPASRSIWKAKDAEALLWECWDDEYVVFQATSGRTHFLNAAGALILRSLARTESDTASLAAEATRGTSAPVDDDLIAQIEESLLRFEQLGLVSRVAPGAVSR